MKSLFYILVISVCTTLATKASADFQLPARVTYRGHDITTLAQHLNSQIKEFIRPYYFYHWYEGNNSDGNWNSVTSALDSRGYNRAMNGALSYWQNYGQTSNSVFGFGLYFATGPQATRSYGGNFPILLQVQLPIGTRFLDLAVNRVILLSDEDAQTFKEFQCYENDSLHSPIYGVGRLFHKARERANPMCKEFLKHVFDVVLRLDAFLYTYNYPAFRDIQTCGPSLDESALVLTSNRRIQRSSVRIFNPRTNDETENRDLIQSLIVRSLTSPVATFSSQMYPQVLADYPRPLWPDIVGHATTPNIDQWIHDNLYFCSRNQ